MVDQNSEKQTLSALEIEELRKKCEKREVMQDGRGNPKLCVPTRTIFALLSMLRQTAVKHNKHCGCPSCCQPPSDAEVREAVEWLEALWRACGRLKARGHRMGVQDMLESFPELAEAFPELGYE